MTRRSHARSLAIALPFIFGLGACAGIPGLSKPKNDGLSKVDDLLTQVERVQVESVLSKERADAALDSLREMVAPDFQGDPVTAFAELSASIEQSKTQAKKLSESIAPMKDTATHVFEEWTASLESIGSTKMRRTSQQRLEATRSRYETIVSRAVSAQIAYDAFNADLKDHALFLEHDFNADAVTALADDVAALDDQSRELDSRLDSCISATKDYVETSALRGQLAQSSTEVRQRPRNGEEAPQPGSAAARRRARAAQQQQQQQPPQSDAEVAKTPGGTR